MSNRRLTDDERRAIVLYRMENAHIVHSLEILSRLRENGRPTNSRNTAPYKSACHFLRVGDLFSIEQVEYNKQMASYVREFVIFNHKNHKESCLSARNPKQGFAQFEVIWHRKRSYLASKTKLCIDEK